MKKLIVCVCVLTMFSCRDEVTRTPVKKASELSQYMDKFNALSFKTFAEFQAIVNDPAGKQLSQYRSSTKSQFLSLASLEEQANTLVRDAWQKGGDRSSLKQKIEGLSSKLGYDDVRGLYVKVFNPGFASALNERGLVFIGNELYLFKEESFDRIAIKDYVKLDDVSVDQVLENAPKTTTLVNESKTRKNADQSRQSCGSIYFTGLPDDCFGEYIEQEYIEGCWIEQHVEGCLTLYRYESPIYAKVYSCTYNPYPLNGDPCPDDNCYWPCDEYWMQIGVSATYDLVAHYGTLEYSEVGANYFPLTQISVVINSSTSSLIASGYGASVTGITVSHSGVTGTPTYDSVISDVYIQYAPSSNCATMPSSPTFTNSVTLW